MTDGPFTPEEARALNAEGVQTAGCWRCIEDFRTLNDRKKPVKTQWKTDALKFIGHRNFCPKHFVEEMRGARDF